MPLGLIVGGPSDLQSGDLLALLANDLFQGDNPAGQLDQQSFKLARLRFPERLMAAHMMQRSPNAAPTDARKMRAAYTFTPITIDGKVAPLLHCASGKSALHMVSAWGREQRLRWRRSPR